MLNQLVLLKNAESLDPRICSSKRFLPSISKYAIQARLGTTDF